MVACGHDIPRGIDLQHPLADHEANVFFFLDQLGLLICICYQDQVIGLIQGSNGIFKITLPPKILCSPTELQGLLQDLPGLF